MKIKEITRIIEAFAPAATASSWDNPGLLVGDDEAETHKVLCALDCTDAVIDEAVNAGAGLIITHHPLLFKPVSKVLANDIVGRKLIKLIKNSIALYSAHTNLDRAKGGVNDRLAEVLGLCGIGSLFSADDADNYDMGRTGSLSKPLLLEELALLVKERLSLDHVRFVGDPKKEVKKVALCSGSASGREFFMEAVKAGCQAYITGDIKFHDGQMALDMGLSLVDATHYGSEVIIVDKLCKLLIDNIDREGIEVFASKADGQVLRGVS